MQQWEYKYEYNTDIEDMNYQGRQGWELCEYRNGEAIFKRPIGPDWKARCEAAEALLNQANEYCPIEMLESYNKWQEIKNKQQ